MHRRLGSNCIENGQPTGGPTRNTQQLNRPNRPRSVAQSLPPTTPNPIPLSTPSFMPNSTLHALLGLDSMARLFVGLVAVQRVDADLVVATRILVGLEDWRSGSAKLNARQQGATGHLRKASSSRERPDVSGHRNQIRMASTQIQQQ